jgi:hypothetical protein
MVDPTESALMDRFGELFRAARVLLKEEGIGAERILPILAFANGIHVHWPLQGEKDRLVEAWEHDDAWEVEAEMFAWKHAPLKPYKIVDGILLLERLPVYVDVHDPVFDAGDSESEAGAGIKALRSREVVVAVDTTHPRPDGPDRVADLYEKALLDACASFSDPNHPHLDMAVEAREDHMLIVVGHIEKSIPAWHLQDSSRSRKPVFPHRDQIRDFYELLVRSKKKRGPSIEAHNLIPACVALCLRNYGKITNNQKRVHELLNEHVLRDTWKRIPTDGHSTSQTNQLWRDVAKVQDRFFAVSYPLSASGPGWTISHNRFLPRNLF